MTKEEFFDRFPDWSPEVIAEFLFEHRSNEKEMLERLIGTGAYSFPMRKQVNPLLDSLKKRHADEEQTAVHAAKGRELLEKLKENPNFINSPSVLSKMLSDSDLKTICDFWQIPLTSIVDWHRNEINGKDEYPQTKQEVPEGYTDIFFWGIPGCGKSSALSALFYILQKKYTIERAPKEVRKFGLDYREALMKVFQDDIGFLPEGNAITTTQYMPFKFKRKDKKYYRKVSFFDLSGELFKHFKPVVDGKLESLESTVKGAFNSLKLVLDSNNEKIHFFFIDFEKESKRNGRLGVGELSQQDYLTAAAEYFKENEQNFERKTTKIYFIITKADLIEGDSESEKYQIVDDFIENNFSNFNNIITSITKKYNIDFDVKLFSIGKVYCEKVCRLDDYYGEEILEDLLWRIDVDYENPLLNYAFNFFRN